MAAVKLDPRTGMPVVKVVSPTSGYTSPPPRPSSLSPEDYNVLTGGPAIGGYATPDGTYAPGAAPATNPWYVAASPPTSTPAVSGTQTKPGSAPPDYASMIANDPGFKALQAELAAGNITAAQFRTAAIQRAIITFGQGPGTTGLDPQTAGFYGQDVTPGTLDLAAKNTAEGLSTTAQLEKQHQQAINNLQNVLAAKGMLESGATGVGVGQAEQANKAATTKATQDLIDYLTGQASAYAEHLHQSGLQQAQGISETTGRYQAAYPDLSGGTTTPGTYTITANGQKFDFGANGIPTWGLVRNATSLPGNTAPAGVGNAMYNADDPTLDQNLTAAKQNGQTVGVWIVPRAGETAAQLGARAGQLSQQYGVEVMFDSELSSKGYSGSPQYQYTQDFVNAYQQSGGKTFSVTVQGGGEDDYNYKAVTDAGGMVWIQTYGARPGPDNMDPQASVDKMIARGVPANQIGVMLAPGQAVPTVNGKPVQWSLYTVDDLGSTQFPGGPPRTTQGAVPPASGVQAAVQNALQSGNYSPETQQAIAAIVQNAYVNPQITTPYVQPLRSRPGME